MKRSERILDAFLILDFRNGNKRAISILVKRWHIKLCEKAYWYVGDRDIAKDIVQDSWQIILRNLGSLKDPNLFGSWAKTIVSRKSIDWIRKQNKRMQSETDFLKLGQEGINENNAKDVLNLKAAILELPQKQQLVLKLFYEEGHSINAIAAILRCSEGTVKSRLFNAREKLKNIIKT